MIELRSLVVAAGMLAGAVLAGVGVASDAPSQEQVAALPEDAVAMVDGVAIGRDAYDRALRAVQAERREALSDEERMRILERLVDEELLVQRALELGLAHHDPQARTHLSAAALALLTVDAEERARDVSDEALRAEYEAAPERWALSERMTVVGYALPSPADAEAAAAAREALETGADGAVSGARRIGLPPGALPRATVSQYLAPSVADALDDAAPGDVLGPIEAGARAYVVRLDAREGGVPRPYEQVRSLVLREHVTRVGDEAVRTWLEERRAQSDVVLPEVAP